MKKVVALLSCAIILILSNIIVFADSNIEICFDRHGEPSDTGVFVIGINNKTEYHTADCEKIQEYIYQGLVSEAELYDAVLYGYTPCEECNAPLLDDYFQEEIEKKQHFKSRLGDMFIYDMKYSKSDFKFISFYLIFIDLVSLSMLPLFIVYLISGARINSRKYNIFGDVYPKGTIWHGFFINYITKAVTLSIFANLIYVIAEFPAPWDMSDDVMGVLLLNAVLKGAFLVMYVLYLINWKKKDFYTNEFAQYNCAKYARLLGCCYFVLKIFGNNTTSLSNSTNAICCVVALVLSIIYFTKRMDFYYPHNEFEISPKEEPTPQAIPQQQIQQNNPVPVTQSNEQVQVQPNIPQKVTVKKIKKE